MSASYPKGLLFDEVVLVTGVSGCCPLAFNWLHPKPRPADLAALWAPAPFRLLSKQAAQGIGRCIAITSAKEGAKVVVSDLDEGELPRRESVGAASASS